MSKQTLSDVLIDMGFMTVEELEKIENERPREIKLETYLISERHLTEQKLTEALEKHLNIPLIDVQNYSFNAEVVQLISEDLAKRHNVIPLSLEESNLYVAMVDPTNYFALEDLRMTTGYKIIPKLATKQGLDKAIMKNFGIHESLQDVIHELSSSSEVEKQISEDDSPIIKLVNQIVENAITQGASDIHLDPQENDFRVRYRIDGVIRNDRSLPKNMQKVITARIKIMGDLNITESRIPQDGRIKMTLNTRHVDIRLSTLPSVYGEKVVMRILDLGSTLMELDKLGFTESNEEAFKSMISRPNGIVLITGPTGSGKSSTLYAALNELNSEEVNIITVEDPVEYRLEGINQIQVRDKVGLTFSASLRSILRQDPDIVMVGEIRDFETAQISIRASLTGHLVLSTLHTNSAVAALTRLTDMGVEPFLITSSISGVIAQRLVRRVCRDCSEIVDATLREKETFKNHGIDIEKVTRGKGCPSCGNTGYRGRLAVHEVLVINDHVRKLVIEEASASEITKYMQEQGMKYLVDDGLIKAKQGLTTLDEVLKIAAME